MITEHQALCSAFKTKDDDRWLAQWLYLIAEYRFDIETRSGNKHLLENYRSRVRKEDQAIPEPFFALDDDLRHIYEKELIPMFEFLSKVETSVFPPHTMTWVRRNAKSFVLYEEIMFWGTACGPKAIAPIQSPDASTQNFP